MVESSSCGSSTNTSSHQSIEAEINEMGRGFLERFDELAIVLDEPEQGYQVKKDSIQGCPVIVTKCRAEGLTAEMLAPLIENPASIVLKMNNKMTIDRLADDDSGNLTYHFGIETPTMAVYNRSMFVTYYISKDEKTGSATITSTSRGNEDKVTEEASLCRSNVVGDLIISY